MKVLILRRILKRGDGDIDIILADNRCVCLHHNGERWISDYYDHPIDPDAEDIWETLGNNSKIFHKDWNVKDTLINMGPSMIEDAIAWHTDEPWDGIDREYSYPEENEQEIIKEFLKNNNKVINRNNV